MVDFVLPPILKPSFPDTMYKRLSSWYDEHHPNGFGLLLLVSSACKSQIGASWRQCCDFSILQNNKAPA